MNAPTDLLRQALDDLQECRRERDASNSAGRQLAEQLDNAEIVIESATHALDDAEIVIESATRALERADARLADARARLERIAQRHANDGHGQCSYCWDNLGMDGDRRPFPCPDYRDATGWLDAGPHPSGD